MNKRVFFILAAVMIFGRSSFAGQAVVSTNQSAGYAIDDTAFYQYGPWPHAFRGPSFGATAGSAYYGPHYAEGVAIVGPRSAQTAPPVYTNRAVHSTTARKHSAH